MMVVMMMDPIEPQEMDAPRLVEALTKLGELLEAAGLTYAVILIGGAALSLRGWVHRTTDDADILAFASDTEHRSLQEAPNPLPEPLRKAIATVGRDLGLRPDWLNRGLADQWAAGLPPGFAERISWQTYRALQVGLAGRQDLIALKLFAAVDRGGGAVRGVDMSDLAELAPSDAELVIAAEWVLTQDAGPGFPDHVRKVVDDVRHQRR